MRINLGTEREVVTLSDAHELPEKLRVKVESVRRRMAGLREIRSAVEREQDLLATLIGKAVKARADVYEAVAEASLEFRAYLLTTADSSLLGWHALHQMARAAGVDPDTGELEVRRTVSPAEIAMLGVDPKAPR